MRTKSMQNEDGAVAITVAVCLLVLMAFTSIALDLSAGYESRRRTLNAADSAALAAAWEGCNPKVANSADPEGAAKEMAALNGYDDADPDISVIVMEVDDKFTVTIATKVTAAFGAAAAIDGDGRFDVVSQATAECIPHPFLGGYALLAFGPDTCGGGVELDLSGASKIINGGLHSNGDIKITGASTEINGVVTFLGSSNYSPSSQLVAPPPNPISIELAEVAPGGARSQEAAALGNYIDATGNDITNSYLTANGYATGTSGSIEIVKSGIYYTDQSISLNNASSAAGVSVTFVARGQISVNGSGDFTAYESITGTPNDPGILMFSTYLEPALGGPTCTGNAIQWSVSSGTWTGVIYAPYGQARQSSASTASLNGSIFAYTIDLSGSDFSISWQDNPDAIPDFEVLLVS
ncbi:MAG TPA: pilus assembly protein TadG-related protein [Acidimicrobiia bacterium]|nr:pilus assembly protein TadG-related protein [Acidimicrobiia bacterium]